VTAPSDPPPLALFWPASSSDSDGDQAASIIQGSDLGRELQTNASILQVEYNVFYHSTSGTDLVIRAVLRAISLWSSNRCSLIDILVEVTLIVCRYSR
jgi:hypothetical protein